MLGLLVSRDGYPLSYCIFNGSQYEGSAMLPIIDDFIQRFSGRFVVVADAGLMSKRNVKLLEDAGYKYIIGARIHTESEQIKEIGFCSKTRCLENFTNTDMVTMQD